jgi:rhamnosyltransferase subunit B
MSVHVVLATLGSAGDVLPFVAVGSELRARGHRVSVMANPVFRGLVESAGLELVATGTVADFERVTSDPRLWSPTRSFRTVVEQAVLPAMRPVHEFVAGLDPTRTVVAASVLTLGARTAHDRHGHPLVGVHLQPSAFLSAYDNAELGPVRAPSWLPRQVQAARLAAVDRWASDRLLAPPVNAFRAGLGLPPVTRVLGRWAPSPQSNLGLFPDWFAPVRPDWPVNMRLAGFVPAGDEGSGAPGGGLPTALEAFLDAGAPPVVVTFGSSMRHARRLFAAAVAANRRRGRRTVVLTRFRDQVPDPLPAGAIHVEWVTMPRLLPRVAAVVHHGGIGTVAQVLRAGAPHLVVPFTHDQPDNANRLVRLGVAERLGPRRFTPEAAGAALDRLLRPDLRRRCAGYAARIDPVAAVRVAADVIEAAATG